MTLCGCVATGATRGAVLVALVPLVPLYLCVTRHYLGTSRELNRLHTITHSPVLNHFGETFSGSMTVRAFRKQVSTFHAHACCPRLSQPFRSVAVLHGSV